MGVNATGLIKIGGIWTIDILENGQVVDTRTSHNVLTYNGLSVIANALAFSGIQDRATLLGYQSSIYLAPIYGAVGNGTAPVTPTQNDTGLVSELGRAVVSAGASIAAATGIAGSAVFSFYFGATASAWSITEAGLFAQASATFGTLVNHAAISPTVTKTATQSANVQLSLSFWADTDADSK